MHSSDKLWVIIPAYNEQNYILNCLNSFKSQLDSNFCLVVVDNASTDQTAGLVAQWQAANSNIELHLLHEVTKGTGWACKRGFDFAIASGATQLARTDADCLAGSSWTKSIRLGLRQYEFVYGTIRMSRDQGATTRLWLQATLLYRLMIVTASLLRLFERGYKQRWGLAPGANLAIRASFYVAVGGFQGSSIDTINEDLDLNNRIFRATNKVKKLPGMHIHTSLRRFQHYGPLRTFWWYIYKDNYTKGNIDVR